ncbi:MAG: efflux RND transporter permease subunit [Gammaproteobacteria bacterium]
MTSERSGLVALFATHPVAGNLLMLSMIVFGFFGISNQNRQVMPDFQLDVLSINVEWPGASPRDVEENIIEAIEPEVRFLEGVDTVKSKAYEGRADISVTFVENYDLSVGLTDVQSAVSRITTFPSDIESPVIQQVINADEVCRLEISGPFSEQALKYYARRIRDGLLERGLSRIDIIGGRKSEIWVEVPEQALRELELSLNDISVRIAEASMDLPSGSVESGGRSRQIRSEGLARTPAEVGDIEIISRNSGEKVRLQDVARVNESFKEGEVSHLQDGETSIGIVITRAKGVDSIVAQRTVETYLRELRAELPKSLKIDMYDILAEAVNQRIDMLLWNGLTGMLLVLGVLYLFLNGRSAFWVGAGIPISILATLGCMYVLGVTLNMISLFAIIMGLGIIVDDAIVVAEHTETLHRRGMSPEEATLEGAKRMFAPVMAASLTTIAAFFPILMVGSSIGQIIGDLPKTVILVIVASLVECFLILPMHLRGAMRRMDAAGGVKVGRFHLAFNRFRDTHFTRFISTAFDMRYGAITASICALVLAFVLMISGRVQFEFFATPEPDMVFGNFALSPGTPREKSIAMLREMERAAYATEDKLTEGRGGVISYLVGSIATKEGRAEEQEQGGDHMGGLSLEFVPGDQRLVRNNVFLRNWEKEIQPVAGVEKLVLSERSDGGPPGKDIDIRVSGAELDVLKDVAMEIRDILRDIPSTLALEDDLPWGQQDIIMELTPAGRAMGFTTEMVARQVRNSFEGSIAKRFPRDEEEVIVRVLLSKESAQSQTIRELYLLAPDVSGDTSGNRVALTEVVNLTTRVGFSVVKRQDGVRQVAITADVDKEISTSNVVLALFTQSFKRQLENKYGVSIEYRGRAEEQAGAMSDVLSAAAAALAMMYIILAWVFSSYRAPFIVMSVIPFGLIGAVLGHYIMGFNMGMFSIFALVGLSGVMINDTIILVTAIRRLLDDGMDMRTAVIEGTKDRLRPVILTTLTTIGGLMPLLFETSLQAQLVQPLAITLVFGMLVSPLLVLVFVPALLGVGNDFVNRGRPRDTVPGVQSEAMS